MYMSQTRIDDLQRYNNVLQQLKEVRSEVKALKKVVQDLRDYIERNPSRLNQEELEVK